MPAHLDRFAIPSQCNFYSANAVPGFCCPLPMSEAGTPQCYQPNGGYWFASEGWAREGIAPLVQWHHCCGGWQPPMKVVLAADSAPSVNLCATNHCHQSLPARTAWLQTRRCRPAGWR